MVVFFTNEQQEEELPNYFAEKLVLHLEALLEENDLKMAEVGLIITSDAALRTLNFQYRGKDQVTDVLSFNYLDEAENEDGLVEDPGEEECLGDIYISIQQARRQASEIGHSLEREVAFLAVHGMLHLLGYDHRDDISEKTMLARQRELMKLFDQNS